MSSHVRVSDLCWRGLTVLFDCLGWVLAGWLVDVTLSGRRALAGPDRELAAFLLVVVIWQIAVDNTDVNPTPTETHLCRRQIARSILAHASAAAIGFALLAHLNAPGSTIAESVAITLLAAASGLGGLLVVCRFRRGLARRQRRGGSVIVYGARALGRQCVESIRRQGSGESTRIVFVDDDPALRWRDVSGCRVVGTGADLRRLARELRATQVVIAFANPDPGRVTDVQHRVAGAGVQLSIFRGNDVAGSQSPARRVPAA